VPPWRRKSALTTTGRLFKLMTPESRLESACSQYQEGVRCSAPLQNGRSDGLKSHALFPNCTRCVDV
jgi:hypothetical protein